MSGIPTLLVAWVAFLAAACIAAKAGSRIFLATDFFFAVDIFWEVELLTMLRSLYKGGRAWREMWQERA